MDTKQLLTVLIIVAAAFILAVGIVLSIFTFYPEAIGLEDDKPNLDSLAKVADTIKIDPTVEITQNKLNEFLTYRREKHQLKLERDSLQNTSGSLIDSIKKIDKKSFAILDSLNKVKTIKDSVLVQKNKLLDSLNKIYKDLQTKIKEVELAQQRIENQDVFLEKKQDSIETDNFKTFAKMYNNSNPQEVAKILEQIDERDASKILKFMQTKKAGKVLESMQPERAAAIMLLGTNEW